METKDSLQDSELLIQRYVDRPSEELKDAVLEQYKGMVERLARRFSGVEPFEDLVQVGFIGLLNALGKFDPSAGVRFNTYATHLVAGEIKHYLRDKSQVIRHPAWLQELRHKINRTSVRLQASLQRIPTNGEIARECGVHEQVVEEVLASADLLKVASFDATLPGDEESNELENFASTCNEQLGVEERVVLEHAMSQLRDLEREVVMRFHFDAMSQTEIAKELNISCNYVSHILRQSLSKLRRILANEEVSDRKLKKQLNLSDDDLVHPLIGAYTEAYATQRLSEEVHRAKSNETDLGLVLVRLTGLESLSSFYGKDAVTDLLADTAEFLRNQVRRLDVVACHGRDGFVVLLPYTGVTTAVVAERLRQKVAPWLIGRSGPSSRLGVEVGMAILGAELKDGAALIAAAQSATGADQKQAA